VFSYITNDKVADGTVLASGRHTRLAPQAYYYIGPFGILGEYVRSTHAVAKGTETAKLNHSAWQVAATYLIGQGSNSFEGVKVKEPLDPKKGSLGVFELAARYNELRIDEDAFPMFADPKKAVKLARGFAGAVNWHWNRNIKNSFTYEETHFQGGAADGDRKTERVLFGRLQTSF
jgi:phosphate-selective porin OprO/OprP